MRKVSSAVLLWAWLAVLWLWLLYMVLNVSGSHWNPHGIGFALMSLVLAAGAVGLYLKRRWFGPVSLVVVLSVNVIGILIGAGVALLEGKPLLGGGLSALLWFWAASALLGVRRPAA